MPDLADILDYIRNAVLVVDKNFKVNYINQAGESLCGKSRDQCVGLSVFDLLRGSELTRDIFIGCRDSYRDATLRETKLAVNSSKHQLSVNFSLSPMSSGDLIIEIEELDRILAINKQDHMRHAQIASRHFVRGVAHEVKNPLGGIRGAAQLLRQELEQENLREYTDIIVEETDRLRNLLDRMLGPNHTPCFKSVNIHEVLEKVVKLAGADPNFNVKVSRSYDPSVPTLSADYDQLFQAFLNIIKNATEALVKTVEPVIKLSSRIEHHFTIGAVLHQIVAHIQVEDNGPGIPQELQEQIFFPLITSKSSGTGLGLAISHAIIGLHKGVVICESESGNTRFHVYLPIAHGKIGNKSHG